MSFAAFPWYNLGVAILSILTSVGRFVEYQLTGQADFRLSAPDTKARTVSTELEGKLQLDEVREQLNAEFGLRLKWPIFLEVQAPPPMGWKAGFYHSEGNLGRYQVKDLGERQGHHITIRPGMHVPVFRAILAHELVHAYQTEHQLLRSNLAMREGMARWVEYHFLKKPRPKDAEKLLKLRHFTFGKSIQTVISYEKEHGRNKTLSWLKNLEKVEAGSTA